jgi:hypothetical protein
MHVLYNGQELVTVATPTGAPTGPRRRAEVVYHTGPPLGERLYREFQREVTG